MMCVSDDGNTPVRRQKKTFCNSTLSMYSCCNALQIATLHSVLPCFFLTLDGYFKTFFWLHVLISWSDQDEIPISGMHMVKLRQLYEVLRRRWGELRAPCRGISTTFWDSKNVGFNMF